MRIRMPRVQLDADTARALGVRRPVSRRVARASGKYAYRLTRATVRKGWARRRPLAPLYWGAGVEIAGAVAHAMPQGPNTVGVLAVVGAAGVWWRDRVVRFTPPARRHAWATYTGAAALVEATALVGPGAPMPGIIATAALAAGVPWWWRHRIRPPEPEPVIDVDERVADFLTYVAAEGKPLPGAEIGIPELVARVPAGTGTAPEVIGWTAPITLPRGNMTAEDAIGKTGRVASSYQVDSDLVVIEPRRTETGQPNNFAQLTIYDRHPLAETNAFPGPQVLDTESGVATIGVFHNGDPVPYRFYRRSSGTWHDLISGTTDAGKSGVTGQLLAIERHCPFMVSLVIDPQLGQSLPEWKKATHVFARGAEEGLTLLSAVRDEMYARNQMLSDIAWTDEKGRAREGVGHFDPVHWSQSEHATELPMISLTIDEAHVILNMPGAVQIAEDIAKMARKCGIKLRLITQVPLLDQLGKSMTLRDMVASGNVIVLRTANRLSGQVAFNGAIPADPHKIPKEFPDGTSTSGMGYVLGAGVNHSIMRTSYDEDLYHWATTGELTEWEPLASTMRACRTNLAAATATTPTPAGAAAPAPAGTSATTAPTPSGAGTRELILAYLKGKGHVHTGVIAQTLGLSLPNTSQTLKRMQADGLVRWVRQGVWAHTTTTETADQAA